MLIINFTITDFVDIRRSVYIYIYIWVYYSADSMCSLRACGVRTNILYIFMCGALYYYNIHRVHNHLSDTFATSCRIRGKRKKNLYYYINIILVYTCECVQAQWVLYLGAILYTLNILYVRAVENNGTRWSSRSGIYDSCKSMKMSLCMTYRTLYRIV